jgi:hypothetical protein
MSNKNENSNADSRHESDVVDDKKEEQPKAIKMAKELQQEQRESEQMDVDPEQVLEEQEKRQPHSVDE